MSREGWVTRQWRKEKVMTSEKVVDRKGCQAKQMRKASREKSGMRKRQRQKELTRERDSKRTRCHGKADVKKSRKLAQTGALGTRFVTMHSYRPPLFSFRLRPGNFCYPACWGCTSTCALIFLSTRIFPGGGRRLKRVCWRLRFLAPTTGAKK